MRDYEARDLDFDFQVLRESTEIKCNVSKITKMVIFVSLAVNNTLFNTKQNVRKPNFILNI